MATERTGHCCLYTGLHLFKKYFCLKWIRQTRVVASKAAILLQAFLVDSPVQRCNYKVERIEGKAEAGYRFPAQEAHPCPQAGCVAGHLLSLCRFGFARLMWKRLFLFTQWLCVKVHKQTSLTKSPGRKYGRLFSLLGPLKGVVAGRSRAAITTVVTVMASGPGGLAAP